MRQKDREIDWSRDSTQRIARTIRAADSNPGVLDSVFGEPHYLFGAHEEDELTGPPGQILAQRHGAVCVGTSDGAVWITHVKAKQEVAIKLPAAQVLGDRVLDVPESRVAVDASTSRRSYREIWYVERNDVGYLYFDFYNGAMSTGQCRRVRDAYLMARAQPTKVIVLMGGRDYYSNGINLNTIEAADDPAEESWHNIVAIDDVVLEVLNTMSHLTVAALRGNAGAGGAMMALAADHVWARDGVVLNSHYKSMGGLYGSEYWTYTLPRRVGHDMAMELTESCRPLGTREALKMGFLDASLGGDVRQSVAELTTHAEALARDPQFWNQLKAKHARRVAAERAKPLAAYRREELARMRTTSTAPIPATTRRARVSCTKRRRSPISSCSGRRRVLRPTDSAHPVIGCRIGGMLRAENVIMGP